MCLSISNISPLGFIWIQLGLTATNMPVLVDAEYEGVEVRGLGRFAIAMPTLLRRAAGSMVWFDVSGASSVFSWY
jgi:hypothetical protein